MDETIVKKEFLRQVLDNTGKEILKEQSRRIAKYLHYRTGTLQRSKSSGNYRVTIGDTISGSLQVEYPIYERFLDISPKRLKNSNRKRAYPIHNSVFFGLYYRMIFRLQNDFVESVRQSIHKQLKSQSNGTS